jgi:hypothetical protein
MFNIHIGLTKLLQKLKFLNYQRSGRYSSLDKVEPTDDNSKHNIYTYNKQRRRADVGTAERLGSSKTLFSG